jgi:hypothetical protein
MINIATAFHRAGRIEEASALFESIIDYSMKYLEHINALPDSFRFGLEYPIGINLQAIIEIYNLASELGLQELRNRIEPDLNRYYAELVLKTSR